MKKLRLFVVMLFVTSLVCNLFSDYAYASQVKFDIEDTTDLEILEKELDSFVIKRPQSSESEQNNHLHKFIENGGLNRAKQNGYLPSAYNLNDKEKSLAILNPVQAVLVYLAGKNATNYTMSNYGYNGYQDDSDAFRHCVWNALMKKSVGVSAATQWANAHESTSSGIDRQMDLYNNAIGRSISTDGISENTLAAQSRKKVKAGLCRKIVNGRLVKTTNWTFK